MFRQDGRYQRADQTTVMVVPADLIGTGDAAEILGRDKSTIIRWAQTGRIHPLAQLDGPRGAYVFDRLDVLQLQAQREKGTNKQ